MEDLSSIMQQMMSFKSNREQLSDSDRRKKAAELVMKLAVGMGGDQEDLEDMFNEIA